MTLTVDKKNDLQNFFINISTELQTLKTSILLGFLKLSGCFKHLNLVKVKKYVVIK